MDAINILIGVHAMQLGQLSKFSRLTLMSFVTTLGIAMIPITPVNARSAHREDSETCASFGAQHGSPDYSRCMMAQQHRRDVAPLRAAEQQQINADTAQRNLEMVRRMRCERQAKKDRANGRPPRWC